MPWVAALPIDAIDAVDVVRWDRAGKTYAIYRTSDDALYASDGLCTHEQAHLADGLLDGYLIACPKHNGRFDIRDGSPRRLPACVALRTYAVRVDAGVVHVNLPD